MTKDYTPLVNLKQELLDSVDVIITKDPVATDEYYFITVVDPYRGTQKFYGRRI